MDSCENAQRAQKQKWDEVPYGDYLNAVDDLLESGYGKTSAQDELAYIAECQEESCSPSESAHSIVSDDWVSR